MGFLTDRKGDFSVFRLSLFIGFLGALLVAFGIFTFNADQEARRQPFNVAPPANAVLWSEAEVVRPGMQRAFYLVPAGDIETVADHYDRKLIEHYGLPPDGSTPENCNRIPSVGNALDYDPADPENIPFYYVCLFDNSAFGLLQFTEIRLQPGVPFYDTVGDVHIIYDQHWEP